jgi:SAM-dependent methyltransferase
VLGDHRGEAANPQHAGAAQPYTFGDTDAAARRLAIVNEVFGSTSRAFLAAAVKHPPALAYDLGCGPGHSTWLLAQATSAKETIGLERALLARAASNTLEGTRFVAWDVTELPFPAGRADLIYARLLLAHLKEPTAVALSWTTQLHEGGLLVVDEIEWIATEQPILQAHLELAASLVASTGAQMCAGPLLARLNDVRGLQRRLAQVTELPVPTATAATMFAMSLDAWGQRAVAAGLYDRAKIAELVAALSQLRSSPATGEITWGLHQAAYELIIATA